jgi:hypothetical protein
MHEKRELQFQTQKFAKAYESENFQDFRVIMRVGYANKQTSNFIEVSNEILF